LETEFYAERIENGCWNPRWQQFAKNDHLGKKVSDPDNVHRVRLPAGSDQRGRNTGRR
jgi:hypothetical protein